MNNFTNWMCVCFRLAFAKLVIVVNKIINLEGPTSVSPSDSFVTFVFCDIFMRRKLLCVTWHLVRETKHGEF